MIQKFSEFLDRARELKDKYEKNQVKVNAKSIFILMLAGAFDEMIKADIGREPTLKDRFDLMYKVRSSLKSTARFEDIRAEMPTELDRQIWLAKNNPTHVFNIVDYFEGAMTAMGFIPTGMPSLKYRKDNLDVFSSYPALTDERCLTYYANRNVKRYQVIVVAYSGAVTQSYSRGKFYKLSFSDGVHDFQGTVWPAYGTTDQFDPSLLNAIRTYKGKVCLVIGKANRSASGFLGFNVRSLRAIT